MLRVLAISEMLLWERKRSWIKSNKGHILFLTTFYHTKKGVKEIKYNLPL